MLDDKFINYISPIKSPFDEEDVSQEDLLYDGYMRYFRDCIIESIGTSESTVQFDLYWDDFTSQCDEKQFQQFIKNCIDKIVKHYKMPMIVSLIEENDYSEKVLVDFIKFYGYRKWLKYYPKCLSFINDKILKSKAMIQMFLTSDYDNFITKLDNCKSCNELILNYYKYCSKDDGVQTLIATLNDDIVGNYIKQYSVYNKNRK